MADWNTDYYSNFSLDVAEEALKLDYLDVSDVSKDEKVADSQKTDNQEEKKPKRVSDPLEQLKKIEQRMEQLKKRREMILARETEKKRKERTHRLIQNGALAEKYLHCEEISPVLFEKFLTTFVSVEGFDEIIQKVRRAVEVSEVGAAANE